MERGQGGPSLHASCTLAALRHATCTGNAHNNNVHARLKGLLGASGGVSQRIRTATLQHKQTAPLEPRQHANVTPQRRGYGAAEHGEPLPRATV